MELFTKTAYQPSPSHFLCFWFKERRFHPCINNESLHRDLNHSYSCLLGNLSLSNSTCFCCRFLLFLSTIFMKRALKVFFGKKVMFYSFLPHHNHFRRSSLYHPCTTQPLGHSLFLSLQ